MFRKKNKYVHLSLEKSSKVLKMYEVKLASAQHRFLTFCSSALDGSLRRKHLCITSIWLRHNWRLTAVCSRNLPTLLSMD